ncbi:beta-Ala-His dipeptidase [Methanolapillus millepedarum]|uniref:Cytosol non-specific dipeptidase n=1 Tax=Methanolapillus millepedarum TaxID=3028296 RepID=A0AA96V3A7_9EURY|nr:Cytosol non-specific dipeptidase [Methanosarcinaceae archaeon Ac7]
MTKRDKNNNVIISVPASPGYEHLETVVLQAHTDMVCEKNAGHPHDFLRDPIRLVYKTVNGVRFVSADGTTLGADNGIGVAYALAAACDGVCRPPLELLLTTDEEEGLTGAQNLSPDFVSGRYLLNLDSETEGTIIAGCAGGVSVSLKKSFDPYFMDEKHAAQFSFYTIQISGLAGGHSGTDINKPRASANVILAKILASVAGKMESSELEFRLIEMTGGSVHNAIAREASCAFMTDIPFETIERCVFDFQTAVVNDCSFDEPDLQICLVKCDFPEMVRKYEIPEKKSHVPVLTTKNSSRIISLLLSIPHGVFEMSDKIPGLVLLSGNFAVVRSEFSAADDEEDGNVKGKIKIIYNLRSGNEVKLKEKTKDLMNIGKKYDFHASVFSSYKPWEPDLNAPLLKMCRNVYQETFQKEPIVSAIHAGLECGAFVRIYPGMQMISIGPDIIDAHSPDETLDLDSSARVWTFIKAILGKFEFKKG